MTLQDSLKHADTLSQATTFLTEAGFVMNFSAPGDQIVCNSSEKSYDPEDMIIITSSRFEGQSNPSDSTEVLALESKDGDRGILVLSHGADHSHNEDTVKKIPYAENAIRS